MNDLSPYAAHSGGLVQPGGGGLSPSRHSRLGKTVGQVQGEALVRATAVDLESKLDQLKLGCAASLASSAQTEVAMLTQVEGELTRAVPLAANRLEFIGNMATVHIAELVADGLTRLRRM
jgi:hypothetical protein